MFPRPNRTPRRPGRATGTPQADQTGMTQISTEEQDPVSRSLLWVMDQWQRVEKIGGDAGWHAQQRDADGIAWADAVRAICTNLPVVKRLTLAGVGPANARPPLEDCVFHRWPTIAIALHQPDP